MEYIGAFLEERGLVSEFGEGYFISASGSSAFSEVKAEQMAIIAIMPIH